MDSTESLADNAGLCNESSLTADTDDNYSDVSSSSILLLPAELIAFTMELATIRIARWDEDDWTYRAMRFWLPTFYDQRQAIGLSHVCRAWRKLSLATASLWTTLRLGINGEKRRCVLQSLCLERSQQSLVNILAGPYVWVDGRPVERMGENFLPPLQGDVLSPELMDHVQVFWISREHSLFGLHAPTLETLEIYWSLELRKGYAGQLPRTAPQLRTLLLQNMFYSTATL
jgi:hypothetical protein